MPETVERKRNLAPWLCFLFTLLAIAFNAATFLTQSGTEVILWLSFVAIVCAVAFDLVGTRRAFTRSNVYGGKASSSIFGVLALLVFGLMAFIWFHARGLPVSAGAPRVGQKAPEFTLPDTQGRNVSLTQLLGHGDVNGGTPPKAVLLIFYRGYW
jgi:hypothetical protein